MSEEFGMSGFSGSKNQEEVGHPSGGRIPYGGLANTLNDGTPPFSNDVYVAVSLALSAGKFECRGMEGTWGPPATVAGLGETNVQRARLCSVCKCGEPCAC